MKSISLNLTTEFLESEAVRNLIITGQQNAILTYISIMTIIRRNGYFAKYDDALMSELERLTCRHPDDLDSDISAPCAGGAVRRGNVREGGDSDHTPPADGLYASQGCRSYS